MFPVNVKKIIAGQVANPANEQKRHQSVQRKSYVDSINYLSNEQKRQLQELFNQLDTKHKNLVLSKIQEQLQLLGGSSSDAKLNEGVKYAVLQSIFPVNVKKIIAGQVANGAIYSNVPVDSKTTQTTGLENQTAVIDNSASSTASAGTATVFGHTYETVPITAEPDQSTAIKTPPSTTTQEAEATTTIPEDPKQAYINQFIQLVKANAYKRLQENSDRLQEELNKYDQAHPKSQNHLQRLRQLIDTDKKLAQFQHQLEGQRAIPAGIVAAGSDPSAEYSDDRILPSEEVKQQAEAQLSELNPQIAEIQKIRKTLRVYYPAIAVLKTEEIQPDTPNQAILNNISQGFQSIQNGIVDVEGRLEKNDISLNKLGPVVSDTLVQLGVNPEKRDQDPKSKAIFDYLEGEEQKDSTIRLVGTLTNIVLGVGAFFATGGTAIFLGIAGALVGLGTAAYELEQADDLYAAARAGEAGGQPLVDDPEEARFNLIMSWANVILAGLDLGFAVKGGTTLLETTSKARRMVKMHDADVLSVLKSNEIAEFKQAIQSLRTGKIKKTELPQELEQLKLKLKQRLGEKEGETVFTQAYSLFQRVELPPARVSELSGFKDLLPPDLKDAVPIQIDASLSAKTVKVHYMKTDGLVSEFYIQVGPKAVGSDIREHVPTVRLMQRYVGSTGRVRMLRERLTRSLTGLGELQVGTKAWEAKFEIEKLERIINGRVEQLAANTLDIPARLDGLAEIEDINVQLNKFERTLATMDESPGVGFVAAQAPESRWIRINETGKITATDRQVGAAIEISQDDLKLIRNLDANVLRDLTTEFGTQTIYQLIKRLKAWGFQKIVEVGGKDALNLVLDIITLEKNGKVINFDDWIEFLIEKKKKGNDLLNVLGELKEAKRLASEAKQEVINIGGDARAVLNKVGDRLPSFDLTVEGKTGTVTRNVDVTTVEAVADEADRFKEGITHAVDKALVVRQGTVEATIRIELPQPGHTVSLRDGRQKYFGLDGRYTITEKSGSARLIAKDKFEPEGDLFQDLAEYITKYIPKAKELNCVTIVDKKDGKLIVILENLNGTWIVKRRI